MEEKARLLRQKNDLQNLIKSVEVNIGSRKVSKDSAESNEKNGQDLEVESAEEKQTLIMNQINNKQQNYNDDFEEPAAGPIPKENTPDKPNRKKQNKKGGKKDKK